MCASLASTSSPGEARNTAQRITRRDQSMCASTAESSSMMKCLVLPDKLDMRALPLIFF
jgi:hypothetical protein